MSINERIREDGVDAALNGVRVYLDATKSMTDIVNSVALDDVKRTLSAIDMETSDEDELSKLTALAARTYQKSATKQRMIEICLEFGELDLKSGNFKIPGGDIINCKDGLNISIGERLHALKEDAGNLEDVLTTNISPEEFRSKGAELYDMVCQNKVGAEIEIDGHKMSVIGVDGSAKCISLASRDERTMGIERSLNECIGRRFILDRGIQLERGLYSVPEPSFGN